MKRREKQESTGVSMACPKQTAEKLKATIADEERRLAEYRVKQLNNTITGEEKEAWKEVHADLYRHRREQAAAVRLSSQCKSQRGVATCERADCYAGAPADAQPASIDGQTERAAPVPHALKRNAQTA